MTSAQLPRMAFFRPDDERSIQAQELLRERGIEPVSDPMLAIEPTGAAPRDDATYTILTSRTSVRLLGDAKTALTDTQVCAIGEATASALEEAGISVDIVPDKYTSRGIVERLAAEVDGCRVEVARSNHGSDWLIEGLMESGAYVHETVLYELVRPSDSGYSADLLVDGELDALLFTSSLTVKHFLEAAAERVGVDEVTPYLEDVIVGAIGPPTRDTAQTLDIPVDVTASHASFECLVDDVIDTLQADNGTTAAY